MRGESVTRGDGCSPLQRVSSIKKVIDGAESRYKHGNLNDYSFITMIFFY